MHHLILCSTCHGAATTGLAARLRAALGADWTVSPTDCMGGCARPGTIAFRAEGKATYLFGDLPAEGAEADILAFAQVYQATVDGWIEDATNLGRLRTGSLARIPVGPRG